MFELEYLKMNAPTVSQYETNGGDSGQEEETVLLKGFASTDLLDREKDFVDPTSFDIPTFLNTPTLYLNHKPIVDAYGNDHEAGVIRAAIPSYISEEASEKEWIVRSIETDEYVSHWPKSKAPNMVVGDRGLFVLAEVTHPMAKAKVRNGVVGGFSWRGYTQQVQHANGVTELKAIDLVEISIVDTPCQPQSTHMMIDRDDDFLKEVSLKGYEVVSVNFTTDDMNLSSAIEQVKSLKIVDFSTPVPVANGFTVSKKGFISQEMSFDIKLSDKIVTLAPKQESHAHPQVPSLGTQEETLTKEFCMSTINPDSKEEGKNEAVKLFLLDQDAILSRIPNVQISHAKSTMLDGVEVEMHTLVIPSEEPKKDIAESSKSEVSEIAETEEVEAVVETEEIEGEVEVEAEVEIKAEVEEVEAVVEEAVEEVVEVEAEAVKSEEAEVVEVVETEVEAVETEVEEVKIEAEAEVEALEIEAEAVKSEEAEVEVAEVEAVEAVEAVEEEVVEAEAVEAEVEVAEVEAVEEVKSEEAPVVEAEAVEAEVEAAEVEAEKPEAEVVSEEAPAEEVAPVAIEEVEAEKSDIEILKSVVMELNSKVESVMSENEKLRSEIADKTEKAVIVEKQAKELSEQKEELDRLANLFSTTTPSEDSPIVEESIKSTPALKNNVVNSLFQITPQGN